MYVGRLNVKGPGGELVCQHCAVADRPFSRLRGLMGRRGLAPGEGLLLKPTPSIHTCFMRFPIDAVFLDADLRVLDVKPHLRPWRFAGRRHARAVLELRGGEAQRLRLRAGAVLELDRRRTAIMEADAVDIQRIDVGDDDLRLGSGRADAPAWTPVLPRMRARWARPGASGPPPSRSGARSRAPRSCASARRPRGSLPPRCWRCSASSR